MSIQDVQTLTSYVHSLNAKIALSIGGATYPFYRSDLYSRPGDLASNINSILLLCGFDSVDFDIEDPSNVPDDFATNAASLINTLKSINPTLDITLTTAAQAWSSSNYQQTLINLTIGNLKAWQVMEYDLWLSEGTSYYDQIIEDINYYILSWFVSADKIVLGLMPGADDSGNVLSLQDSLNLTTFAKQTGLQGVMTWDANNDGKGCDGNAQYAYCMGIQQQLKTDKKREMCCIIG